MDGKRLLRTALVLGLLGVAAFSGWKLWDIQQVYQVAENSYEDISTNFVSPVEPAADTAEDAQEAPETVPISVSFEELKTVYGDVVAWLYCADTPIDYPVVQGTDNDYYLNHLPNGKSHIGGSIFMDYRAAPDFSGYNTVLYGHNMKNDSMFGSLSEYRKQEYYDAHPVFYLLTPEKDYLVELLSGCTVSIDSPLYTIPETAEGRDELAKLAARYANFDSDVTVGEEDRLITLSTCTSYNKNSRYVLVGVLRELDRGEAE